jgi:hypothetical protein
MNVNEKFTKTSTVILRILGLMGRMTVSSNDTSFRSSATSSE